MAVIDGRVATFLRDCFGGEVPLSCAYPPLELALTAAVLRQAGIDTELIPANVLRLTHEEVARRLRRSPPSFVLIPSAWGSLLDDFSLLETLRAALPDTKLILYGPKIAATPEEVLSASVADYAILAEPEEAMLLLAQGADPASIPNLAFRGPDGIVCTERRLPPDYPDYPLPARDLLDLSAYTIPFARRSPATTLQTVRGCLHSCTFCPTHIWNKRTVRARPLDSVMAEITELVERYGIRELIFRDDTFTWSRDRVLEFCQRLRASGLDVTWRVFGTANTVDAELLRVMARAGCTQVCYGFETGDQELLRQTAKRTTVQEGRDAARWTHEAGMEVAGTFLVGLEGETRETVDRSIRFAIDCELDYVQVNVATPLPGTTFGRRADKQGRASRPEMFRWFGAGSSAGTTLTGDEIAGEARRFYRTFYVRPAYIAGRLRSRRGIGVLATHARLGLRMLRSVAG